MSDEKIKEFLAELTWLSLKHGLAINRDGSLWEVEADDYERRYRCDDESNIEAMATKKGGKKDQGGGLALKHRRLNFENVA